MVPRIPVPAPPPADLLKPVYFTLPAGQQLVRCHKSDWGATEFNPGSAVARFSPFRDAGQNIVPRIYAAEDFAGALAESVFHDIPLVGSGRTVAKSKLETVLASRIHCTKELTLVSLDDEGLAALGLTRSQLIETNAVTYNQTVDWAEALYNHASDIQGLTWMSRLYPNSQAFVIFGDRSKRTDWTASVRSESLVTGSCYNKVKAIARNLGITITV